MSGFICPVCGKDLIKKDKSLVCENGHNFDVAKAGYVNLLLSRQIKEKHHGDDKMMVLSRRDFLNKGYYSPLLESAMEIIKKYAENGFRIIDAGCGECWYTASIYENLHSSGIMAEMLAVDISKDALAIGSKRNKEIMLAVASIFHLPIKENSCDMLLNFFAPMGREEFFRVLKNGGYLIKVFPLEKHLWGLKAAIYDTPYENETENPAIEGFELIEKQEIRSRIFLKGNEDIINVFRMTPYYYKTSVSDQKKMEKLTELNTEIELGIYVYQKTR